MAWKLTSNFKILKILLTGAVIICFLTAIYMGTSSLPKSVNRNSLKNYVKETDIRFPENIYESQTRKQYLNQDTSSSKHHLGVIVPFRDRFEELLTFAPYLHEFLTDKHISHDIIIVNQVDTYRFNRAALINAGFLYLTNSEFSKRYDYIAMHDVDLLPLNYDLPYDFPEKGTVMHVAGPGLHPKYNYPSFIGGILLVTTEDFAKLDGMSNLYWGWGMEDDEFFVRLKQNEIQVRRPTGLGTGRKDTFRHIHSPKIRPRDTIKCFDQLNKTKRRDRLTGLSNLNYTLLSTSNLEIDKAPVTVLNVKLHCNTQISPWCDCGHNKTDSPETNNVKLKIDKKKVKKRVLKENKV